MHFVGEWENSGIINSPFCSRVLRPLQGFKARQFRGRACEISATDALTTGCHNGHRARQFRQCYIVILAEEFGLF